MSAQPTGLNLGGFGTTTAAKPNVTLGGFGTTGTGLAAASTALGLGKLTPK